MATKSLHTKESLITELQRFYKEFGKIPSSRDFIKTPEGYPSRRIITKIFGDWPSALKAAGFQTHEERLEAKRKVVECGHCGTEINTTENEDKKFCNSSCAASFNNTGRIRTEESKKKTNKIAKTSEKAIKARAVVHANQKLNAKAKRKYKSKVYRNNNKPKVIRVRISNQILSANDYKNINFPFTRIILSKSTGRFFNAQNPKEPWETNFRIKTVTKLSEIFQFKLGQGQKTLDSIKEGIETIKYMYMLECLSPPQIFEILEYNINKPEQFMERSLFIPLKSALELGRIQNEKNAERNLNFWKYRIVTKFKFGKILYPIVKGFELYLEHGYQETATDIKLERDHMFSVLEGFKQRVPCNIINHPANCEFLLKTDNNKKRTNCSITLEQLYERIKMWEYFYGHLPRH